MTERTDVAVVGAGLAGMAAAVFAGNRGLSTVQVGNASALLFASGLFDLMGVHPIAEGRVWSDPFAAAAAVGRDDPGHPYARVSAAELRAAFDETLAALAEAGLPYEPAGDHNCEVVTGAGTVKTTYAVPRTMAAGVTALAERAPCLLVDFEGLREYSARGVAEALRPVWPGLGIARVAFPGPARGESYAAHLARALELADGRAELAARIRPHLGQARAVGLPAILGVQNSHAVAADLAERLGAEVFEIPSLPTSVPGLRLRSAFERAVAGRGVRRVMHGGVTAIEPAADGFVLRLGEGEPLQAASVVLATGRFLGGGLVAERGRVRETLLNLHLAQPASRAEWHRLELFDPRGHALNRAGVEVDGDFRPRDEAGRVVHPRLFAAGILLAHQDWARQKCGAGVALGSAYRAVGAIAREQRP